MGLGGVWGFGTFLTYTDNAAKMQLYYRQDGTLTLL